MGDETRAFYYVSIGNSANKLSQYDWSTFCTWLKAIMAFHARSILGIWFSLPDSSWQNMCMAIEMPVGREKDLTEQLGHMAHQFSQDSIAMVKSETTLFIAPQKD